MQSLWYLQPFRAMGPLVSMLKFVLADTVAFVVIALCIIVGFGLAFVVLLDDVSISSNISEFASPLRSFESLYHTLLGEFDAEVRACLILTLLLNLLAQIFHLDDTDGFISVWRILLLNLFLFLGTIVLLSLLISILGDTYDRVKLTEEGEQLKCRARIVTTCSLTNWLTVLSLFPIRCGLHAANRLIREPFLPYPFNCGSSRERQRVSCPQ